MKQITINIFLAYLRFAAKIQLLKMHPKNIIGITGSAGKSSCREAVYAVLKDKFKVKQSTSGNSETGLPLDILGFGKMDNFSTLSWIKVFFLVPYKLLTNWQKYEIYVAEMGIDAPYEPKNMSYLLRIIQPNIGIFLNVASVHGEYFHKNKKNTTKNQILSAIANEKGKLITSLPSAGYTILNSDDPNVINFRNQTRAKIITFGSQASAQIKVSDTQISIPDYALSHDYDYTFTAAFAVGKIFGLSEKEIKACLIKNFTLPSGRASLLQGINNSLIIDSTYNSNLLATKGCLKLLKEFKSSNFKFQIRRRIAILGDMRELGNLAKEDHERLAEIALECANHIFTFGPLMEKYFLPRANKQLMMGNRKSSHNVKNIKSFTKMSELIHYIKDFILPGDLILVKGSQNTIFLETLVEAILKNSKDAEKLCRRGKFWDEKRRNLLQSA